jgi:hypothetical protein
VLSKVSISFICFLVTKAKFVFLDEGIGFLIKGKSGHSTSSQTDLGSIRNAKDQMGERKEEEK